MINQLKFGQFSCVPCMAYCYELELVCRLLKLTVLKAFGSWGFTRCPVSPDLASLKPLAGHFTDGILSILYKKIILGWEEAVYYITTHRVLNSQFDTENSENMPYQFVVEGHKSIPLRFACRHVLQNASVPGGKRKNQFSWCTGSKQYEARKAHSRVSPVLRN